MRCYFHLVSYHDAILDETGIEVTDLEAAETEALKAIRELREEEGDVSDDWQDWQLRVTDRSGQVFLSIPLDPAAQRRAPRQGRRAALKRIAQMHALLIGSGSLIAHLNLIGPWG